MIASLASFRSASNAILSLCGEVVSGVRLCFEDERRVILGIINLAAQAYRGVIPQDRWHEPYMPLHEFEAEKAAGVAFWGYERDGALIGVMGIQPVHDVELIRHAYVLPGNQRHGVGAGLITHLQAISSKPMLVGTWAAATWAIDFYRRHQFELVGPQAIPKLLRKYWTVPEPQIEASVVLANPRFEG